MGLIQSGFNAGFEHGKDTAEVDGYKTGLLQGKEISREIGFYKGFVSMLLLLVEKDDGHSEKQKKLLEQLNALLADYSYDAHEFDNMQVRLGNIRSKFKQI